MNRPASPIGPLLMVLGGVVSVQFGGALAATLVPRIGAGGSVLLRLGLAMVIMLAVARPRLRGHSAHAWRTVVAYGVALGLMNFTFYGSLAHLPIGVAVTIEFIGPLTLAAVLSKRPRDLLSVLAAAIGVVLISRAFEIPFSQLPWTGLALALTAGVCWAAYIVLSGRTGQAFAQLDGLAIAMVVSTALVFPVGVGSISQWTRHDLLLGFGIALLSSVVPYSLELMALRHLPARVFGILLSLEPAVAALAGLLILRQRLGATQLLGMGLVVAASVLVLGLGRNDSDSVSDDLTEPA